MYNVLQYQFNNSLERYGYNVKVNSTADARVMFKEYEEGSSPADYKYMLVANGLINQGDIVKVFDDNWFVLGKNVSINDVYTKFVIRRLKFNIKFNFEGEVISFPSAIDEGTYRIAKDVISLAEGKIVLHLQENQHSKRISVGQKFLIMGNAWSVVQKTNAEHGIYKIYANIDVFNNVDDDKENEIADRWKYETKPKNIISVASLSDITVENSTSISSISLPKTVTVTLEDDSTTTLSIVWNTSNYNKDIAGTYNLKGTLTLTKGVKNTNNLNANINIIVKEPVPENNYTIKINNTVSSPLTINSTLHLIVTVTNNGEIVTVPLTYTSSDTNTLTVDEGLVTCVGVGTANITVAITEDLTITDTIVITVEEVPVPSATYTITIKTPFQDDDPNELWYGETYKYTVHKFIDDVEVSGSFTFALSDTSKATISNSTNNSCDVTAKSVFGNHIIKLIVTDINTNEVAIERTINIMGR